MDAACNGLNARQAACLPRPAGVIPSARRTLSGRRVTQWGAHLHGMLGFSPSRTTGVSQLEPPKCSVAHTCRMLRRWSMKPAAPAAFWGNMPFGIGMHACISAGPEPCARVPNSVSHPNLRDDPHCVTREAGPTLLAHCATPWRRLHGEILHVLYFLQPWSASHGSGDITMLRSEGVVCGPRESIPRCTNASPPY